MLKIEHLGIAVKNLEDANKLFAVLLGAAHYKTETVETEKVSTSFFKVGESKIELLEASDPFLVFKAVVHAQLCTILFSKQAYTDA